MAATLVVQATAQTVAQAPSLHLEKVRERPTSGPVVRFGRPPTTTRSTWDIRDWSLAQINAYIVEHFGARLVTMDQLHPLDAPSANARTPAAIDEPSAGAAAWETAVPAARRAWVGAIPILATGIGATMVVLAGTLLPAPVRVAATLVLALTLGFAVSIALVPQSMRLGARFVLTIAVSLGVPAAIALLLTLVGVPIERTSLAVGALVIVMLALIVGVWRGAPAFGQWRTRPFQPLRPVAILLCAAAVAAFGVALAVRFQGLDSTRTSYTTLAVDPATVASGAITVEVVNAEGNPVEYQLDVTDVTDGTVIASDRRVLADAASWQYQLEARPEAGSRLRISLYRVPDVSEAYRELEVVVGEAASNVPASAK